MGNPPRISVQPCCQVLGTENIFPPVITLHHLLFVEKTKVFLLFPEMKIDRPTIFIS